MGEVFFFSVGLKWELKNWLPEFFDLYPGNGRAQRAPTIRIPHSEFHIPQLNYGFPCLNHRGWDQDHISLCFTAISKLYPMTFLL